MARLRATILGCGASPGVPRIGNDWGACDPNESRNRRTRCALLVERFDGQERPTRVLVDTGPDLRAQLLAANVDAIDGVVYTHAHADHLHGIDDLRAFWLNTRRLVDIYADDPTTERLIAAFRYCFETPPGAFYPPILKRHPMATDSPLTINGPGGPITLVPFAQRHGDIDSLGLRIGRLAYSCDVSGFPDESLPFVSDLDVWILDALRYDTHPSHLSVREALEWIDRMRPARAVLTHMHLDLDYRRLAAELPEGVEPAFDGMEIEFATDSHEWVQTNVP
jgi:phosphoribosyl 1,2-cyclic phosphate phosphodiesterase